MAKAGREPKPKPPANFDKDKTAAALRDIVTAHETSVMPVGRALAVIAGIMLNQMGDPNPMPQNARDLEPDAEEDPQG